MAKTYTERTLETLVEFADLHRQSLTTQRESIDALTQQVGVLSENLTRIANLIERQENKLDRILDAIQGQNRIAEAQASNIAALTRLVEMLVSRN